MTQTQPLDVLLNRVSVSVLQDPPPEKAVLDRILETGLRAPDHGKLRPWRFVLIQGSARDHLADVVGRALRNRDPDASDAMVDRQRSKFLNAPLVIALGVHIVEGHKIPEIEQTLSMAAATMNLLNAIHAEGFGAIWVTGANAYDPAIRTALGLVAPDRLLGFLFVGTPGNVPSSGHRAALSDHVREWTGVPTGP